MSEKKPKYKADVPRPEDIKITKKSPTTEELREYRAAWLREAEENGTIDDLFLIVKTFGVVPETSPYPGYRTWKRKEFTDGDSEYVILYDREVWVIEKETVVAWERIIVVEDGEPMRELLWDNKRLVSYFRRLSPPPSGQDTREKDKAKSSRNFYVPGYWEGLISDFAWDAKHELTEGRKQKADQERKDLLNDLFHGQGD